MGISEDVDEDKIGEERNRKKEKHKNFTFRYYHAALVAGQGRMEISTHGYERTIFHLRAQIV